MKICCIGSREITPKQVTILGQKGSELSGGSNGPMILSGNAPGADQAWVSQLQSSQYTLYLPWDTYEPKTQLPGVELKIVIGNDIIITQHYWDAYAKEVGKWSWDRLTQGVKRLMARNLMMIKDADEVWAAPQYKDGEPSGGTAFGIFLARVLNKSYNLLRWDEGIKEYYCDSYGPPNNTYVDSNVLL